MQKLIVFNNISLDGSFTDANGDMSWAYAGSDDPDFRAFTAENAKVFLRYTPVAMPAT